MLALSLHNGVDREMAKVILTHNKKMLDTFELDQGDMKIGRRPDAGITIDSMAVSGEHANIFTIGEDSFIQDLGSTTMLMKHKPRWRQFPLKILPRR